MVHSLSIFLATLLLSLSTMAQQIRLVKDSILNVYMENGYANKHFRPDGKTDNQQRRQGKWKDYEVAEEGSYQLQRGAPVKYIGNYLLYGEGNYFNSQRTGDWKIYVIEDKTFKKILSQKLTYEEGERHGPCQFLYPDGKVAQTGEYIDGKLAGASTLFYPNGTVYSKQLYKAGKKHGQQEYFYPSGKVEFFIHYNDGLREGKYEGYYENGAKQEFFQYKADSLDGVYQYYYPSGQLWTEKVYKNGKLWNITALFDQKGGKLERGTLRDGNGSIQYYTEEGKVYSIEVYQDGVKVKQEDK